ncbi:hypothetical protein LTS18_004223, partial [Coniosporium uncinatum]
KRHRKALAAALDGRPEPDVLSFLLAAVLCCACSAPSTTSPLPATAPQYQDNNNNNTVEDVFKRPKTSNEWHSTMQLAPDPQPYANTTSLSSHTTSYAHLLTLLPLPLLDHATPQTCLAAVSRDSWNSFGVRSLEDGGDEFFGYGIWPGASYFNHSCRPGVGKRRGGRGGDGGVEGGSGDGEEGMAESKGRTWSFWLKEDVREGEEMCISYLGGEEETLGVRERRRRLKDGWGFVCGCEKCAEESGEGVGGKDVDKEEDVNGEELAERHETVVCERDVDIAIVG